MQNCVSVVIGSFESLLTVPLAVSQSVLPFFVTSTTPLKPVPSSIAFRYACFSFVPHDARIASVITAASSRAIVLFIVIPPFFLSDTIKQE